MKCSEIEERLTAYLENFLQKEDRDMIEKHCAECSNCRRSLQNLQKRKTFLKSLMRSSAILVDRKNNGRISEKEEKKGCFSGSFTASYKDPIQALA